MTPNRAAMPATEAPSAARRPKASTWSIGCMAARTMLAARDTSTSGVSVSTTWQGMGASAAIRPWAASSRSAARRRPPSTTAWRAARSSPGLDPGSGSTSRTARGTMRPWAWTEAYSSRSAVWSGAVLRMLSGEGSRRSSGIDRVADSVMSVSMVGTDGRTPPSGARSAPPPASLPSGRGEVGRGMDASGGGGRQAAIRWDASAAIRPPSASSRSAAAEAAVEARRMARSSSSRARIQNWM